MALGFGRKILDFGEEALRMGAVPIKRMGEGMMTAAGQVSSLGTFNDATKRMKEAANKNMEKGLELQAMGRSDEAQRFFKLAQDTNKKYQEVLGERVRENEEAFEDTIKGTVGTASYLVPGGKTLKAKAALGALAGAGGGFGVSEKGEELETAVEGAVIGGALPVAFEGLKKLGNVARGGDKVSIRGKKLDKVPWWTKAKATTQSVAEEIGITDKMSPEKKVITLNDAWEKMSSNVKDKLTEGKTVTQDTILEKMMDNYEQVNIPDEETPGVRRLLDYGLKRLKEAAGDNVSLYDLKTEARLRMGNYFNKGGSNPTPTQEVWKLFFDTIKDSLDTVSPEVRSINRKQKILFDLAEEFIPEAIGDAAEINFRVPFTNAGLPLNINQSTVTKAARGVVGAATAPFRGVRGASRATGELGEELLSRTSAPSTALVSAVESDAGLGETPQDAMVQGQYDIEGTSEIPSFTSVGETPSLGEDPQKAMETLNQYGASPEILYREFTNAMTAGDKKTAEFLYQLFEDEVAWQKAQGGGSDAVKETAMNSVNSLKSLYDAVQEKGYTASSPGIGRISGALKGAYGSVTQTVPEASVYSDTRRAFLSSIARGAGEKGILSDPDVERMDKALPKFSDSPEVAKGKWMQLARLMQEISARGEDESALIQSALIESGLL